MKDDIVIGTVMILIVYMLLLTYNEDRDRSERMVNRICETLETIDLSSLSDEDAKKITEALGK